VAGDTEPEAGELCRLVEDGEHAGTDQLRISLLVSDQLYSHVAIRIEYAQQYVLDVEVRLCPGFCLGSRRGRGLTRTAL
jgi:hypothetical protein